MQSGKYLIEFTRFAAKVVVEYNETGWLIEMQLEPGTFTEVESKFLYDHFPVYQTWIERYRKFTNVRVTQLFENLDFPTFWNTYAYKIGNKSRAERLWQTLKPPEQAKAMSFIVQYNQQLLLQKGVAKLYPETYLQQQRWNN